MVRCEPGNENEAFGALLKMKHSKSTSSKGQTTQNREGTEYKVHWAFWLAVIKDYLYQCLWASESILGELYHKQKASGSSLLLMKAGLVFILFTENCSG